MKQFLERLLTSRMMQWVILTLCRRWNPGGWVFIRKDDTRFVWGDESTVHCDGDPTVPPTTPTTDRTTWSLWMVVKLEVGSPASYLMFDTFDGRRLICLGQIFTPGSTVAFRVGHEASTVRFVRDQSNSFTPKKTPKIRGVTRLRTEQLASEYPNILRV